MKIIKVELFGDIFLRVKKLEESVDKALEELEIVLGMRVRLVQNSLYSAIVDVDSCLYTVHIIDDIVASSVIVHLKRRRL